MRGGWVFAIDSVWTVDSLPTDVYRADLVFWTVMLYGDFTPRDVSPHALAERGLLSREQLPDVETLVFSDEEVEWDTDEFRVAITPYAAAVSTGWRLFDPMTLHSVALDMARTHRKSLEALGFIESVHTRMTVGRRRKLGTALFGARSPFSDVSLDEISFSADDYNVVIEDSNVIRRGLFVSVARTVAVGDKGSWAERHLENHWDEMTASCRPAMTWLIGLTR